MVCSTLLELYLNKAKHCELKMVDRRNVYFVVWKYNVYFISDKALMPWKTKNIVVEWKHCVSSQCFPVILPQATLLTMISGNVNQSEQRILYLITI